MPRPLNLLIVEDSPDDAELLVLELRRAGFAPKWKRVETEADFLKELRLLPDLILCDYSMPQFSGLRAAQLSQESGLAIPFILISGTVGEEVAVEAMKRGATDYLLKDRIARLGSALERALEQKQLQVERQRTEQRLAAFSSLGQKLSAAKLPSEAAEIILDVADQLFGWDACSLDLYSPETDLITPVMNRDTIAGRREMCPPAYDQTEPSAMARRVIEHGPQLVLRQEPYAMSDAVPFGDKSRASASLMFVPIRDAAKVIGILSIQSYVPSAYSTRDLSELQSLADHCGGALNRIQATEALRQSEERFRQLAENINEVFWITDHARQRMLYISPAYEQIWGRTCASLYAAPQTWPDSVHPEDRSRILQARVTRQPEGTYDEEYRVVRPDDSIRWIHERAFLVRNQAGQVERIVGVARDVTENRKLEELLRQSQKMDAIGQLAGGVAHDFNNILAVIQMQAGMLRVERNLPPAQLDFASEIEKAALRGANLTRQLLLFSRRQTLQPRDLDLNELIANITKMLQRILGEDIQTRCTYAAQPMFIHADAGMMDQVLMNLTVNSRDAMPQGGQLHIETSPVDFDAPAAGQSPDRRPGAYVCLSVSDTGCGIPPAALSRIFEPFFTTKEVGKGTGLGLATVFGIVQQHQGWVEVSSETGVGTTFRVYLPRLIHSAAVKSVSLASGSARGTCETILVVEDDPAVRGVMRITLSHLGYRVLEAATGASAMDVWRRNREHVLLVLTDLVMPDGMSGRQLAGQLLLENPRLKIIYTSGYNAEITSWDFQLEPGVNFIAKPFQVHELAQTVRARLDLQNG